jgi:hypothetical protein
VSWTSRTNTQTTTEAVTYRFVYGVIKTCYIRIADNSPLFLSPMVDC